MATAGTGLTPLRVLVTGGDHTGTLAAIRGLRKAGHFPSATVSSATAFAGRSRATSDVYVLPDVHTDRAGFVSSLVEACEDLEPDVLLPGTEAELVAISHQREQFGSLASRIPDHRAVMQITDKGALPELAARAGLQVPPTFYLDARELEPDSLTLPAVIKPLRSEIESANGFDHSFVHAVEKPSELLRLKTMLAGQRWLVQPLISGRLAAICGVAWRGEIISAVHQQAERIWPTLVGASAFARTIDRDVGLEEGVARLVGELSWSGIFQVQFIHNDHGHFVVDVNPRIYGSLSLAIASGVNLPAMWVALASGGQVCRADYKVGVTYRSEIRDAFAVGRMFLSGHVLAGCRGLLPRPHTVHEVGSFLDPLPLATALGLVGRSWLARRSSRARDRHPR